MRNLYARFILWLIQPALERHSCGRRGPGVDSLQRRNAPHWGLQLPEAVPRIGYRRARFFNLEAQFSEW